MIIFNTIHKKKSAIITALILIALVWIASNVGMKYLTPPLEYGIRINFGTANFESKQPSVVEEKKRSISGSQKPVREQSVIKVSEQATKEQLITQSKEVAPVFLERKKTENEKLAKKNLPILKAKKPSESTLKAFDNLLKENISKEEQSSQLNNENESLKGDKNGLNTNNYYKYTGKDVDSNYNLAGRSALRKPVERPKCQEEGLVVVSIEVDKTGQVIKATAGVKGTTNSTSCLLKPARTAALKTTWNADPNAPSKQKGTIIYKFSLSK